MMRTAKPEITANSAVCDGALGSIPEAVDKIREKRSYLTAPTKRRADKTPCRRKRHGGRLFDKI